MIIVIKTNVFSSVYAVLCKLLFTKMHKNTTLLSWQSGILKDY